MTHLYDANFLNDLFAHKVIKYYAILNCLDYATEQHLINIKGIIIGGDGSITAKSPIRRTVNLNILFDERTSKLIKDNNLISVDKKIEVIIGVDNPFHAVQGYEQYGKYGEIVEFKMGRFFISSCSASTATNGDTISMQLIDKMGGLNGYCGGTLPATVAFHEKLIFDAKENYTIEHPLIKDIIYEAVHHLGGEHRSHIFVEDVPDYGRQVAVYNNDTPIWFKDFKTANSFPAVTFVIGERSPGGTGLYDLAQKKTKGQVVGYLETPLTYPGELVKKSGSTVVQVLDDIASVLGNYEYFYDVEGNFHFKRISNYDKTGGAPLVNPVRAGDNAAVQREYIPSYLPDFYYGILANNRFVVSSSFSPKYDNIKNDYICWGTRKEGDVERAVRYHLAIDDIPKDDRIIDAAGQEVLDYGENLCNKWIIAVRKDAPGEKDDNIILRYEIYQDNSSPRREIRPESHPDWFTVKDSYYLPNPQGKIRPGEKYDKELYAPALRDYFFDSIAPQYNWREELYRRALLNYGASTTANFANRDSSAYDAELIAEWRKIYNPTSIWGKDSFKEEWNGHIDSPWTGYHPNVVIAPHRLDYWLDIISSDSPIGRYSISKIGRRTYVSENSKINEVYPEDILDIVFFEIPTSAEDPDGKKLLKKQQHYISIGQSFCQLKAEQMAMLKPKNSFGTCYEDVRQAFLEHTIFNSSISLQIIPLWFLDVNKVIRYKNDKLGLEGDYVIESINWSISKDSASMNLTLSEALVII